MARMTVGALRERARRRHPVKRKPARARRNKDLTQKIKAVVAGQAETKMVTYFGGSSRTGLWADRSPVAQNQLISQTGTDVLRVIPYVTQGSGDNQRNGIKIMPTSLSIHCKVNIAPTAPGSLGLNGGFGGNYVAVAYLLQSQKYRTYVDLSNNNDFTQLLDIGDDTTTAFNGEFFHNTLPVAKQYYRLLAKKVIPLRNEGVLGVGSTPTPGQLNNTNSAPFASEWTWNAGKHLPKHLIYPEAGAPLGPGHDDPQNAALFWSVGYYFMDGTTSTPQILLNQEYTAIMKFKDF